MTAKPQLVAGRGGDFLGLFTSEIGGRLLGTMMKDRAAYELGVEARLDGEFGVRAHDLIYRHLQQVGIDGEPNAWNVFESMGRQAEAVGGLSGLIELTAQAVDLSLLPGFIRTIKEHAADRRRARIGQQFSAQIEMGDMDAAAVLAQDFLAQASLSDKRFSIENIQPIEELGGDELRYVAWPIVVEGTVTTLTGASGCGKSSLITLLGWAVAHGRDFLGFPTLRREVIILDRENPLGVKRDLLRRLSIQSGDGLTIWGGWCEREPAGPDDPALIGYVRKLDPKPLLIFDSLIAFARCDENDASAIRAHYDAYRRLANLGASVIVVAHTGKGDAPYRGSSDIPGSSDAGWLLQNLGEDRLDRLVLKDWKRRFSVGARLNLEYSAGGFRLNGAPPPDPAEVEHAKLQELHSKHPLATAREWDDFVVKAGLGREAGRRFRRSNES